MRTIEISLFEFSELSENAKRQALYDYRSSTHFEDSDYRESVEWFCSIFGLSVVRFYDWTSVRLSVLTNGTPKNPEKESVAPCARSIGHLLWHFFCEAAESFSLQEAFHATLAHAERLHAEARKYLFSDENLINEIVETKCEFYKNGVRSKMPVRLDKLV